MSNMESRSNAAPAPIRRGVAIAPIPANAPVDAPVPATTPVPAVVAAVVPAAVVPAAPSVVIPAVLRPYMGGLDIIEPAA